MASPRPIAEPTAGGHHTKRGCGLAAHRIRREADTVRRVTGPSVIRLVDYHDDVATDTVAATYERVPGGTVALWHPADGAQVASMFAAAAQAVHELHRCGVAHGAICAEHLLIDESGRPVLCGLADARPVSGMEMQADLRALASVVIDVLDGLTDSTSAGWAHRLSRAGRTEQQLRALAAAIMARHEAPEGAVVDFAAGLSRLGVGAAPVTSSAPRSPAESLTAGAGRPPIDGTRHLELARPALAEALPATRSWRARPVERNREPEAGHRRTVRWALAIGAAVIGAGAALLVTRPPEQVLARSAAIAAAPATEETPPPVTDAPALAAPTAADPHCDGVMIEETCTPIETGPGIVVVGDHRFAVGSPTDQLVVGDWDCDGTPTVAAVRTRTGEVFVFDRWSLEQPIAGRAVALLDDAGAPVAVERPNGCHDLRVSYGTGIWTLSGAAT